MAIAEPIQDNLGSPLVLWGEDALLKWPNAMQRLIDERDAYMARSVAAAAVGKPCAAPAFVSTVVEGRMLLRYHVPQSGPDAGGASVLHVPSKGL